MTSVPEYFGSMVFDDRVMRAQLSARIYKSLRRTIDEEVREGFLSSDTGAFFIF